MIFFLEFDELLDKFVHLAGLHIVFNPKVPTRWVCPASYWWLKPTKSTKLCECS